MRKVNKNIVQGPPTLTAANLAVVIPNLLRDRQNHDFRKDIYGSPIVHGLLSSIYKNKCAYCETDTVAGATLQVEHYRPKGKVYDAPTHTGYYWLGYEWTNLLLACSKCNRSKSAYFEISGGVRASIPLSATGQLVFAKCNIADGDLTSEYPCFLNPEIDIPDNHLVFSPSGKIHSKGSKKGDYTIDKCKLNRRPLRIARKKIIDSLLSKILKYFNDYQNHGNLHTLNYAITDRLIDVVDVYIKNQAYSMFAKQIMLHFEYFVVRRFERPEHKTILRNAHEALINQYRAQIQ